jgi:hypothetical protein
MQITRTTTDAPVQIDRRRDIGTIGTTARVLVGFTLVGSVLAGHLTGPFAPGPG